jgi:anti-anti-sigma regulatory factor
MEHREMEDELAVGDLEIKLRNSPTRFRVLLFGEADEQKPDQTILPFLEKVSIEAISKKQKIVINLSRVEFMNSSCIGMITSFLMQLDEKKADIEVVFNTSKTWQVMIKRCMTTIFILICRAPECLVPFVFLKKTFVHF